MDQHHSVPMLDIPVQEGYGQTEETASVTLTCESL